MAFDRLVALARTLLQLLYVHEANVAPSIANKARLLKRTSHQGDARASNAEHLAQKFLRQLHFIGVGQVANAK